VTLLIVGWMMICTTIVPYIFEVHTQEDEVRSHHHCPNWRIFSVAGVVACRALQTRKVNDHATSCRKAGDRCLMRKKNPHPEQYLGFVRLATDADPLRDDGGWVEDLARSLPPAAYTVHLFI